MASENAQAGDSQAVTMKKLDAPLAPSCGRLGCPNEPVIFFELATAGEWAAEVEFCAEHIGQIAEHAQAFAVAVGLVKPASDLERNVRATFQEHAE